MAGWAFGPDDLKHLFECARIGLGCLSEDSACGLPETGRPGEDDGEGRCRVCAGIEGLMAGEDSCN